MEDELIFPKLIDGLSAPVATTTPEGRLDLANGPLLEYLGASLEELRTWEASGLLHPDDLARTGSGWRRSLERGEPYAADQRVRRADGAYRWAHLQLLPFRDAAGNLRRWCLFLTDIDDRKRGEALLDGERSLLQMVASGRPLVQVLDAMCALVETTVSSSTCSVLLTEPDGTFSLGAGPTLPPGYGEAVRGAPVAPEAGPCGTAASTNQRVVVPDLGADPRWVGLEWRTLVLDSGLRSVCSTPIVSSTGHVLGTFAIYQQEPKPPGPLLNELISRFTHVASIAIERSVTENELREREHESRRIVDTIPGLVATLTPTGQLEAVNQQILAYCGRSADVVKQWERSDIVHPQDLPAATAIISASVRSGQPYELVERLRRFDGVYRWFQARGWPLRDSTGNIVRWYVLLTDIEDLKQAEQRLASNERNLKLTIDTIPALAWSARPDGSAEFFNQHYLDYTGLSSEQASGWGWTGAVHPDDLERLAATWQRILASGAPGEAEARLRRFDGAHRWFLFRASPLRDGTGAIVKWFGVNTDIEDRKRAEAELGTLKDQLHRENLVLRDEVDRTSMFEEIVGVSPALKSVLARLEKVAETDSTVLITGETGTGKELVARAIHRRSARSSRPFVSVNCAAVPRDLIASELFGHERGAFTGAAQRRLGRFELAHGGTLFLDEVGDLPMEMQVALLRVLQEREVTRVGGSAATHVDVRVIAATNCDLHEAMEEGTFRSDLFYRLNVFPIVVPPLRERAHDISLLVEYFIDRYARKTGKTIRGVNKRTLDSLKAYPWPGNVRELQNVIERSVILSEGEEFTVDESWLSATPVARSRVLSSSVASHERSIIEDALRASAGRVFGPSGAAARLGIARSTLESKIRTLGIDKNRFRSRSGPK